MKEPEWWRINAAAEKVIVRHEAEIAFLNLMDNLKAGEILYPESIVHAVIIAANFNKKIERLSKAPETITIMKGWE